MANKKLVGAIIAGGRGSRFNPVSLTIPKALLPIVNKAIIIHQIEYLKELGIEDIFIVVGYLKEQIMERLGDGARFGVKIKYVIQEKPEGSGHAVGLLQEYINNNFILFLGDISIKTKRLPNTLRTIYRAHRKNLTLLACKVEEDLNKLRQNFTITLDKNHRIIEVIEKPQHPSTNLKGCGVYLFTPQIFNAIRKTPRSGKRNEYELTNAIQTLIESGHPVFPIQIIDWDVNISSAEELFRCNYLWLKDMHKDTFQDIDMKNLIGQSCKINPNAQITNSIIGDYVEIQNPISITYSIVFSDTVVTTNNDLVNKLVTPDCELQV